MNSPKEYYNHWTNTYSRRIEWENLAKDTQQWWIDQYDSYLRRRDKHDK